MKATVRVDTMVLLLEFFMFSEFYSSFRNSCLSALQCLYPVSIFYKSEIVSNFSFLEGQNWCQKCSTGTDSWELCIQFSTKFTGELHDFSSFGMGY